MENPDDPLSSSVQLPPEVEEVKPPTFNPPPDQRGEGQPSPSLRRHVGASTPRHGIAMTVGKIMIALFLWFFSIDTLNTICQHTNAKAVEKVWKTRHTHPDGRVYYKVCCMRIHACIHISMRMHGRTCIQSHTYMHSCDHINACT